MTEAATHRTRRPAAWWRVRRVVLRSSPRCVVCGAPATEADHIVPVADGGAMLALDNLQALCQRCHAEKTAAEA